ncbi:MULTISPECIES: FadR/GntR family transcriptional regulator [Rhizobium]|uniref:DNA-binding transcriptional regulator, FadR family n=1 Tax=Rhizobium miluonense TaxID=411945 RepID=A0A1C3UER9_9HYPH|nr:FadR/GntR family transcriptional regulator [Rhizobium miluonense]SCB13980.1 DNA-binding transcriptional regulator, FadR family [Rhizobium miluonense]
MRREDVTERGESSAQPSGRRNLVDHVAQQLRQEILGGISPPGEKLPSENGLTERYKVSRTVIREAIASLRADGLVEVRHGVGVFVSAAQSFPSANLLATDPARISSIIEMLELRTAVETEAAGIAAVRRSPAQEEAILERCKDIDRALRGGIATSEADFAFHLAIADATNNPRFKEFLELTGKKMIPRSFLLDHDDEAAAANYIVQIQAEHRQIAEAISDRDEQAARAAMRLHLTGSQQRYRSLIRRSR